MDVNLCRACLGTSPVMNNIFDNAPRLDISIADMITQCTRYEISEGDHYPKSICESCLQCAQAAFEIRKAAEKSHQVYLLLKEPKNLPALSVHIRTHTGERPFKCTYCPKSFTISCSLQKHIRIHTGERPYKCTYCSKSFTCNFGLKTHIRSHTGDRPYKCSHCLKSFSTCSGLQRHYLTHTGGRRQSVPTAQRILQTHIRTRTKRRQYKFSNNTSLQKHIRIQP